MGRLQERVTVARPREVAWEAVVDFESRPRWSPRVKEAKILEGAPLREGSRVQLQVDGQKFTPKVTEMRASEKLVMVVRGPGFRTTHTYELQMVGESTLLTLTGDYGGLIGWLIGRLMGRSMRKDLVDELAAIKGAAEASPLK